MLYNGVSPYPEEKVLKLSDAFEEIGIVGFPEKGSPALELAVKVKNINYGKNEGLARKCRTLAEYSAFVDKVRVFEKECGSREEAKKYCRKHDILKEFLGKNATEVINMLMY